MYKKFFTALAAMSMLCLICTGCLDSVGSRDDVTQGMTVFLDQQLCFKNEPAVNSPTYLLIDSNPREIRHNRYQMLSSKDCLRASIKEIILSSSLAHSRYLTIEQVEQIADKFADLQEQFCSYDVELLGDVDPSGYEKVHEKFREEFISKLKVYDVKITAPDFAAIETMIFNNVKNEFLSKVPVVDNDNTFETYSDIINFNERDPVTSEYRPPLQLTYGGPYYEQNHLNILWTHYEVDRDLLGRFIFEQFMSVLNSNQLPFRTISLRVSGYKDEFEKKSGSGFFGLGDRSDGTTKFKVLHVFVPSVYDSDGGLVHLNKNLWKNFGKTFGSTWVFWNRTETDAKIFQEINMIPSNNPLMGLYTDPSEVKAQLNYPAPSVLESDWGSYISKNGEPAPPCKEVIVNDELGNFKGFELNNISMAVCDVKETINKYNDENKQYSDYTQKVFEVTLIVENASDKVFPLSWLTVTDEYGDELLISNVSLAMVVPPRNKAKITLVCNSAFFFTNERNSIASAVYGSGKYTAGYDPNTETLYANDKNKKRADLVKWQKANNLRAYDMPREYLIRYGKLTVPLKVIKAD